MQLDYAIEVYWLAKRRDFSANTINDYTLTFRRLTEFVGKTRELKDISSGTMPLRKSDSRQSTSWWCLEPNAAGVGPSEGALP